MAARLKCFDIEKNRWLEAEIGLLTPDYNFNLPTVSVVDGDQVIKFTRDGAQTWSTDYGPLNILSLYPLISYDTGDYQSVNRWFRFGDYLQLQIQLQTNTVRVNQIKYKGAIVPYETTSHFYGILTMLTQTWSAGWKIGIANIKVKDERMYALVGYTSNSDYRAATDYIEIFAFSPNALTDNAYTHPYENDQDATKPGDPDGEGGYGTGLPDGDNIGKSDVSSWSFYSLGAGLNAYHVDATKIKTLSDFLWGRIGNAFDASGLIKGMWARYIDYKFNPIAAVISLHKLPAELEATASGTYAIQMAGYTFDGTSAGDTQISASAILSGSEIKSYTSGVVPITTPYTGFRDFSSTKVKVYVPFCGSVSVDPSCCVGGSIYLYYQCDNITGNLAVQVRATDRTGYEKTVATMSGNCAMSIPLTGNDNGTSEVLGTAAAAAVSAITMNAGGLAASGLKLGLGLNSQNTIVSGNLSGNVGFLGDLTAWVEVSYGIFLDTTTTSSVTGETEQAYNDLLMRPSCMGGTVSEFNGRSQLVLNANDVPYATDAEKLEIERMCREGVLI